MKQDDFITEKNNNIKNKKKGLKNVRNIVVTLGFLAGGSIYNGINVDDLYDSIEEDTTSEIISLYCNYDIDPITSYDSLVSSIALFYKDYLCLDDPNQIFVFYCYMKDSGYFSINNNYSYASPSMDVFGNKGINVVLGKGVCEHETSLFKDILDKMGYENYKINCSLDYNNVNQESNEINALIDGEKNQVERETICYYSFVNNVREKSILPFLKYYGDKENPNHTFNAVVYNNEVYYFDTTNCVKWSYLGDNTWKCLPLYDSQIKEDVYAKYAYFFTKVDNDIGNTLSYSSNDEIACRDLYSCFSFGDYDMLFNDWYNSIPSEVFESIKNIEDYKKLRR